MMLVRNVRCIADEVCEYGSWLEQWKMFTRSTSDFCSRANCKNTAEHGVLVQKVEPGSYDWYLVPLCAHHYKPAAMALLDLDDEELIPVKIHAESSSLEMSF